MEHEGLLKAKNGNNIYAYIGDDKYVNLTNGGSGKIHKEDASRLFVIPLCLNNMAQENPILIDLISKIGMTLDPLEEGEIKKINEHYSK